MKNLLLAAAALLIASTGLTPAAASAAPAPCAPFVKPTSPSKPPAEPPLAPTTVDTLKQAYDCIFTYYYGGPRLDDRVLLAAAFAGLTQELQRRGKDHPAATMPPLTGNREADWTAFAAVYERVTVGADAAVRQALAAATMRVMVAALDDNHAAWERQEAPAEPKPESKPTDKPTGKPKDKDGPRRFVFYGIGIAGLSSRPDDPAARGPLFVTSLIPASPAERQGVRPGDVIVSINGVPPFINGALIPQVLEPFVAENPNPVRLALRRPSTGKVRTVKIKPGRVEGVEPAVTAKRLDGGIGYVKVPAFSSGVADRTLRAIAGLGSLKGLVLDLRGNGGGSPREVTRLLGTFAHGKVTSYFCDVAGACTPNRTDDSVPLLKLPLAVLTDRDCASACDDFSAAVKDLRLGTLVGTWTAGLVSGPGEPYPLQDGSVLLLPRQHHLGPNRELINTIGVAVDHYAPMTAEALSAGRDPGLTKALQLLG
ncbi:S41 family peptidase [Nonomuraea sp. LPB2021202275-12-8]|uniref:S41 family peptidase n=1 Tax=Nonomuraea sp. LPB2021202275-12-8 TaxID=3120159 RepID=UPI00300C5FDA